MALIFVLDAVEEAIKGENVSNVFRRRVRFVLKYSKIRQNPF